MTVESDITIIGAGIAGMCAAVMAARNGMKVALVHNRPVLGGNASSEICITVNGAANQGNSASVYARESGIVGEIVDEIAYRSINRASEALLDMTYFEFVYKEPNIQLFLNTNINNVKTNNHIITEVSGFQLNSEQEITFKSPLYMDSSGDGFVGYKCGAEFRFGRESRDEFDESLAPVTADKYLQGSTLIWKSVDVGRKVEYSLPEFAYDVKNNKELTARFNSPETHRTLYNKGLNAVWWMEYGGQCDTISQNEEVTLELRKLVYGFWDYVKNSGEVEGTENYMLSKVAPVVGKRESRRFVGDVILKERDILERSNFPDVVSYGGWPIDIHAPMGVYDDDKATSWKTIGGIYDIPYRCLYSKNIDNLFFGGRIISVSHVAFGSTRVIGTGAAAATAAAVGAVICNKYGITPREAGANHMDEIINILLKSDQFIPGKCEKIRQELLPDAIDSSSQSLYQNVIQSQTMTLSNTFYLVLPVKSERLDSIDIRVRNTGEETTIHFNIYGDKRADTYLPDSNKNQQKINIQAHYDGWITVPVNAVNNCGEKVYVGIEENNQIEIYYTEHSLTGALTFEKSDDETVGINYDGWGMKMLQDKNICFKNVLPKQDLFGVENLLNGFHRPNGLPNAWVTENKENQWVELSFEDEKYIEEIHLVFNNELKLDHPDFPAKELVKDYDLIVDDSIIPIRDNHMRVNVHKIGKKIKKLKIELIDNYGHPKFEMFSIKLY